MIQEICFEGNKVGSIMDAQGVYDSFGAPVPEGFYVIKEANIIAYKPTEKAAKSYILAEYN